jgi:nanoRNase/pAp phosphatase (c-di-AMP/oligoRNAs hydrolase)
MSRASQDDSKIAANGTNLAARLGSMTPFVESCVETVADSAGQIERRSRHKAHARHLLKVLAGKKNILITTHRYPDPDALASSLALCTLLKQKLPNAEVDVSIKGSVIGGLNATFAKQTDLKLLPWSEELLETHDAVILVDTQPHFANSPLPANFAPLAVIDHHRSMHRRAKCPFCDIRADVGATGSIIFSYFMELEAPISRDLAATLLYAIESDLAGAAGKPGELDNIALSSLTLMSDTRKLYEMRYVDLPRNYYIAYANGVNNAVVHDEAIVSHLDEIDTPEKPAIIADFLLRFDQAHWALVTAIIEKNLVLSLRTDGPKTSAADIMRRLVRDLGEGGGHRTKAGGYIRLNDASEGEITKLRDKLRRRLLRSLKIKGSRPQRLVPKKD